MVQKGFLFFCLLVSSLLVTTSIHARELPGQTVIECSGVVHNERDGNPASGDADKAVAHHHGCHGASSFLPGQTHGNHAFSPVAAGHQMLPVEALGCFQSGPDLRPPIA